MESYCPTAQWLVFASHYNMGRIALHESLFVTSRGHTAYARHKVMFFNWWLGSIKSTASHHHLSSVIQSINVISKKYLYHHQWFLSIDSVLSPADVSCMLQCFSLSGALHTATVPKTTPIQVKLKKRRPIIIQSDAFCSNISILCLKPAHLLCCPQRNLWLLFVPR